MTTKTLTITNTNTNQDLIDVLNALLDEERDHDGYVPPARRTAVGELCDAIGIVDGRRLYLVDPDYPVVRAIEV
jgi:hypothetical protein